MNFKNYFSFLLMVCLVGFVNAQEETFPPVDHGFFATPILVPSFAEQMRNGTFIEGLSGLENRPLGESPEINIRHKHVNNVIPGKGLPAEGQEDPLARAAAQTLKYPGRDPIYTNLNANNGASFTPTDPTVAVGPNHVIAGWNIGFRIFNKDLTPITNAASLNTIFSGQVIGDPIFLYDHETDRFVITEFSNNPNGFKVAVSQGPDPVNDGWFVYQGQFNTGAFPDYTKFSIWHDGYYVTANIGSSNRLFVVEREKMLLGQAAQFQSFQLPGIVTPGFYSPQVLSAQGSNLPTTPATVVYQQDDSWGGVSNDHLKLWSVNVNWITPGNSTISSAVQIPVTPFNGVFNGGSFNNLPQPFGGGPQLDVLQATIMNQAQLRKFDTYNMAVFNFVVRVNTSGTNQAGIRWYELRQNVNGGAWTIHQEGTYTSPGEKSAFNGSMSIDVEGNIGMAYSTIGTRDVQERISIKYTGRFAGDPLGQMTVAETQIGLSTANATHQSGRYADYSHTVVDPFDGRTFYNNNEFFNNNRRNILSSFRIAPEASNDVGVIQIISPENGPLADEEEITVLIRNFGIDPQSNFDVFYNIDGGDSVVETFTGTIASLENASFTFNQTADLSLTGTPYIILASTDLENDEGPGNNQRKKTVVNEPLNINDIPLQGADLIVLNKGNNQFEATLTTNQSIEGKVFIKVYNISGQVLAYNLLENNNGKYTYNLDMSYASSGVYLVRIGTDTNGFVKRIIVR